MRLVRPMMLVAIWPVVAGAQVELRGRVLSSAGDPIAGATITVGGIGYSVKSDSSGRFGIAGAGGSTLQLFFTATGYRRDSAAVPLGRSAVNRDFTLVDATVPDAEANRSTTMQFGRVVDEAGVPLSYANVQVNYGTRFVADDSGRFSFPFDSGSRTLLVRRIGFEPLELRLTEKPDTAVRIVLTPIAAHLKEVTVVASGAAYRSLDLHGFYRRMREAERSARTGWFITPEDIARRNPTWTTQMVDGLPTVRVRRSPMPTFDVILGRRDCEMTVYLDNIRITNKLRGRSDFVNELVPPGHMAAMEIYPSALNAPPQFQPLNGTCGVVLIWTK